MQKPSTALGAAGGINLPANRTIHKNLEKALAIKGKKKAKCKETKLISKGIHMAAMLWKIDSTKMISLLRWLLPGASPETWN